MSEVGTLYINVLANGAGVSAGLGAAEKRIATFSRTATRSGAALTKGLTLPILAIGAASAHLALDFDHAMAKIAALTGTGRVELEKYRQQVLKMAPALGKSPKELADALYFIVSSGQKGAAALSILTASAKASAAGLGETKVIADAVTSAVNAYGIKALSAASATDALIAGVREGKMVSEELAGSLGRVIAPAEAMGVSFDQVVASLASFSRIGLNPEEGATALRGLFMSFLKPTKDATDQLAKFGLSADSVRESIASNGLMATLMMLRGKIGDNKDELAKIIPNVRALNGFLALTGRNAGANSKIFDKLAHSTGATGKAFKTMSEEDGFKLKQALAELEKVGIGLGENVVPMLVTAGKEVAGMAEAFDRLSPSTKKTIVQFALFVAVVGPLLSIIGKVGAGIGVLIKVYSALRTALLGAAAAQTVLNAAQGAGAGKAAVSGLASTFGYSMAGGSATAGAGTVAAGAAVPIATAAGGATLGAALGSALGGAIIAGLVGYLVARPIEGAIAKWASDPSSRQTLQNLVDKGFVAPTGRGGGGGINPADQQAGARAAMKPIIQQLETRWKVVGWGESQKVLTAMHAMQALADKGIVLNMKDLGKQGPKALNAMRDQMVSSLGITKQQATQILNTIAGHKLKFTWDKQTGKELAKTKKTVASAGGKIVRDLLAAGDKGGDSLAKGLRGGVGPTRTAAAALAAASDPHLASLYPKGLNLAKTLAAGMNAGVGPVLQAALALAAASKVTTPIPQIPGRSAAGRYVTSPMLTWVGENFKPEVVLPITDKPRTLQLMNQAGMLAPGFFGTATAGAGALAGAMSATSPSAGSRAGAGAAREGDTFIFESGCLFAEEFDRVIAEAGARGTVQIKRRVGR